MLTAKKVERTKTPGRYHCGLVRGLYLQISDNGAKSYVLRFERHGCERMMGLGSASEFSLKEVRDRARAARQLLADGIDPLDQKHADRAAAKLTADRKLSFRDAAKRYFDQNQKRWRSASHRDEFLRSLEAYAYPVIGGMDVAAIGIADVLHILEPIWASKTTTADRVRVRIAAVLDWCVVRGHRPPGTNPAAWKGHLDQVLPPVRKVAPVVHHPAMDYRQVPQFVAGLCQLGGVAPKALQFLILTAARAGEVANAMWDEIDFDNKTWVIGADRMKGHREHRVPLAPAALDLLHALPRDASNPHIFIGARSGAALQQDGVDRCHDPARPAWCDYHPWLSIELFQLGARANRTRQPYDRDFPRTSSWHRNGACLPAYRHGRQATATDGSLVALLHIAAREGWWWRCRVAGCAMSASVFKAPADLFRDFSEAQWREIAESLMDRGVDLDALKGGEFVPGTQWWLPPDFPPNARSVRHGLKAAAFHYGLRARTDPFSKELPTPVKQINGLRKQLEAIEHAIDTIYRTETAYPKGAFEVGREVPKELLAHIPPKPILAALWQYRDELRDQIAALRAAGTRRDQNARTIHNDYWRELARLWVGITGSAGSKRRQQLRRFLLACTPLTLFPDITEQELPQKLDSFVASFFRR